MNQATSYDDTSLNTLLGLSTLSTSSELSALEKVYLTRAKVHNSQLLPDVKAGC